MRKNVAGQRVLLGPLLDESGLPITAGAAVSVRAGGVTAAGAGSLTHVALGVWEYVPTQAETNHDLFAIWLVSGTSIWAINVSTSANDWTDAERAQIRFRLGINGTATAPDAPANNPVVITPPQSALACAGWLLCLDVELEPAPDVEVSYRMIRGPGTAGYSYDTPVETATSDAQGIVTMPTLRRGSTIEYWRTNSPGNRKTAVIPNASTVALPELL